MKPYIKSELSRPGMVSIAFSRRVRCHEAGRAFVDGQRVIRGGHARSPAAPLTVSSCALSAIAGREAIFGDASELGDAARLPLLQFLTECLESER